VAEFERDLLIERTNAGLKRAKAEGKVLGRPSALSAAQLAHVRAKRAQGVSLGILAKELQSRFYPESGNEDGKFDAGAVRGLSAR
jgi:DNA invertase Pin-like site-specific DNA recombinase